MTTQHVYEVRQRKDKRGVDLVVDALLFGGTPYNEANSPSCEGDLIKGTLEPMNISVV